MSLEQAVEKAVDELRPILEEQRSGLNLLAETALLSFLSAVLLQILRDILVDSGKRVVYEAFDRVGVSHLKEKILAILSRDKAKPVAAINRGALEERTRALLTDMGFPIDVQEKLAGALIDKAEAIARNKNTL